MVLLNAITLRELFEVREAVEVELAGLAAERATEEDLSLIKSVLERQKANLDNPAVSQCSLDRCEQCSLHRHPRELELPDV